MIRVTGKTHFWCTSCNKESGNVDYAIGPSGVSGAGITLCKSCLQELYDKGMEALK